MSLTPKELKVMEYIENFIIENNYSPSYREIQSHMELASIGSVQNYIKQLTKKGFIEKTSSHQNRSLRVLKELSSNTLFKNSKVQTQPLHQEQVTCTLPILGSVAAGLPLEAKEFDEFMDVPISLAPQPDRSFMLRVSGDSMIEEGIHDKDLLLVEERSFADNGNIVVASTEDEAATVKKIFFENNQVELRPSNSAMSSFWYKPEQITIKGLVIGLIRKYGKI